MFEKKNGTLLQRGDRGSTEEEKGMRQEKGKKSRNKEGAQGRDGEKDGGMKSTEN